MNVIIRNVRQQQKHGTDQVVSSCIVSGKNVAVVNLHSMWISRWK